MTAPCKSAAAFPSQGLLPTTAGREVLPEQGTAPAWAFPAQCHIPAGRSPELWEQSNMGCQAWGRRGVLAVLSPTWQEGSRDRGQILVLGPHPSFPQRLHQLGWFPAHPTGSGCCGHCQQAVATPVSPPNISITPKYQRHPQTAASSLNISITPKPQHHPQISSPPNIGIIPKHQHHS